MLTAHGPELARRHGARRLAVFGSYARGDHTPSSDVDVLVEFETATFDNYMDLKFALEELLGKQVDLVVIGSLKPALRETVMAEAKYVA